MAAGKLMHAVHETSELLLQYLEALLTAATEGGPAADRQAPAADREARLPPAVARDPLLLGAVRCVGRFAAEAPDAVAARLHDLLPALLQARFYHYLCSCFRD